VTMNDISELAGIDRQRFGDSLNFPGSDCSRSGQRKGYN
jgi:hypothetical protein